MQEEIEKRAVDFLDFLSETAKAVGNNVSSELPSIYVELVNYLIIQNVYWIAICVVAFVMAVLLRKHKNGIKQEVLEQTHYDSILDASERRLDAAYCVLYEIIFWIATVVISVVATVKMVNIVYLIFTPRAYLLMYIVDLVGKK